MSEQTFRATIVEAERGRVRLPVPFDPREVWGKEQRHYVQGTINDKPFTGSLGSRGGEYFMPLNKELRATLGVEPGDDVAVVMRHAASGDSGLPAELTAALAKNKKAREFFEGLSSFYKNEYVKWITSAKTQATRDTRLAKTLELLKEGKKKR